MKKALNSALEEFLLSIGYDFAQELRATSLRMDSYLRKQLEDFHHRLGNQLIEINKEITITSLKFNQNRHLEFENAFDQLNRELFQKAMNTFKNPKAFFEKNEKKKMSEDFYQTLQIPADDYLQREGFKLNELYNQLISELFEQIVTHARLEVEAFYDRFISSLENKGQAEDLSKVLKNIEKV